MKRLVASIPNLLTLCNLLCGGLAIYSLSFPEASLVYPTAFLLLAALFDVLDGFVARLLKAESPIGADLDSLSDVVSFGVAPMLLTIHTLQASFFESTLSIFAAIPLFFPALAGAYRLARYNNSHDTSTFFTGMPIPSNAIFWIGYAFVLEKLTLSNAVSATTIYWITLFFAIVMGVLMISRFHFLSLKGLSLKGHFARTMLFSWIALVLLLAVLLVFFKMQAFAPFILAYTLLSILLNPLIRRETISKSSLN